jgi:hypothetical protein
MSISAHGGGGPRGPLIAAALLAGTWFASYSAYQPGPVRGSDTPLAEFSGARAGERLHRLLWESAPHPMGSAANAVVRERIVAQLRELGYDPELQAGVYECDAFAVCGTPINVVARLGGTLNGASSVLLAAHYDSVPAGPGASDDGAGVAEVLEIARVLRHRPPLPHPVVFLLGDGEELGLLGAKVFVEHHPWATRIKAAVNLDNRGTSGPALMFETGSANAWLMGLYAGAIRRPLTNSVYYTVYKQLPNNTDFTVFKAAGYQGFNFAFIGSVARYHTPFDDVAHAHLSSIESQGEAALSVLLALAGQDVAPVGGADPPPGEAVYFDLLGLTLVRLPQAVMMPAAAVTLVLTLLLCALFARREEGFLKQFALAVAAILFAWAAAPLLAYAMVAALRAAAPSHMPEYSAASFIAETTCGALAALLIAGSSLVLRRRVGFHGFWCANLLLIAGLAMVAAAKLPGASYLFLVPAIVGVVMGFVGFGLRRWRAAVSEAATCLYLAAMFTLLWPILVPLYDGLGRTSLPLIALLLVVGGGPLAALLNETVPWVGRKLAGASAILLLTGIVMIGVVPAYTTESPERLNVRYLAAPGPTDQSPARWLLVTQRRQVPHEFQAVARFERRVGMPFDPFLDFGDAAVFAAAAPSTNLEGPLCELVSATTSGEHSAPERAHYRMHVASPRAAAILAVGFAPAAGIESVRVMPTDAAGQTLVSATPVAWGGGWRVVSFASPGPAGIDLEFDAARDPFDVEVLDRSYGLPAGGAELQAARSSAMTTSQDGDVTLAARRVQIGALAGAGKRPLE